MLLAGDDAHNVFKPTDIARDFTMIFVGNSGSSMESPEAVYRALESGAAYGVEVTERLAHSSVSRKREGLDSLPLLQSCRVCDDSLVVVLSGSALCFSFIGQDGLLLKRVSGETGSDNSAISSSELGSSTFGSSSASAFYKLRPEDHYVRVKITLVDSSHIYLNPVMRTKEKDVKPQMPPIKKRRLFTIFDA
jgi:hypothetical protein